MKPQAKPQRIDFAELNRRAVPWLPDLLARWLPDGKPQGREWVALNPRRSDRHPGSFAINLRTGAWADFADPSARGRDVIGLAAYLFDLSPGKAAKHLADALRIEVPRG